MKKLFQNLLLVSIIGLSLSCKDTNNENRSNIAQSDEAVLQHTVYFYLNDNISDADKQSFENGLQQLLSIESVYRSEMGKTAATPSRPVTDHEFDYSIFAWFKSMNDYKVYADHPDHLEFIKKYELLWKDVKVYDSEIFNSNEQSLNKLYNVY